MTDTLSNDELNRHVGIMKEIDRVGGFCRKPNRWKEVGLPLTLSFLEGLKQYTSTELGVEHNLALPFLNQPEEAVFLVGHAGGLYLINTEGGGYARCVRYVGQTVDKLVPDTLAYVIQAFKDGGYNMSGDPEIGDKGLETATFLGISPSGNEMYKVTFTNHEGEPDSGVAYVSTVNGKKVADF